MNLATEDQSKVDHHWHLQEPEKWVQPVPLPPLPAIQPNSRSAVVTLGTGARGREMLDISRPSITSYAQRIGADYHEITGPPSNPAFVFWDKFRPEQFFDVYERIVYIDADIVVRPTAPNLLELVPETHVAVHDETPDMGYSTAWIFQEWEWLCRSQGYGQIVPRAMFNTGFWVASRQHRETFQPMRRPFNLTHCAEQCHISLKLHQMNVPIWPMSLELHWQHWSDKNMKRYTQGQFVHHSGMTDHQQRLRLMRITAGIKPTTKPSSTITTRRRHTSSTWTPDVSAVVSSTSSSSTPKGGCGGCGKSGLRKTR